LTDFEKDSLEAIFAPSPKKDPTRRQRHVKTITLESSDEEEEREKIK